MDMQALLDFSQPINVPLFDHVVTTFYTSSGPQQAQAQRILTEFQDHPDAWSRADAILENAASVNAKFIALQILEKLIQTKWKILPPEQREGIKNYIVSLVLRYSSDEESSKPIKSFLAKLNLVLVQILKQEWPHNWPNFIPEIVGASRSSIPLCENNMAILKLLSEEIFDFSAEQMTQTKARSLKQQMCGEFSEIYSLCFEVLENAAKPSLLQATLGTLLRFLNWIPLGYIFQTELIPILVNKFLEPQPFRNITLKCLTEIAALEETSEYRPQLATMFTSVLGVMVKLASPQTDFEQAWENSGDADQEFIQNLGLFFTTFLGKHLSLAEQASMEGVLVAHEYLVRIARVDDREVFKLCLDYFNAFSRDLYSEMMELSNKVAQPAPLLNLGAAAPPNGSPAALRKTHYSQILTEMRLLFIERMVKPEEVLVVENEDGAIVRESMKEVDTIVLYKTMREVLVYLTNLDAYDTERIMAEKLARQMDGSEWSWANLNKLCWAVGSISGAMSEDHEKNFLVHVIKELLCLVDQKRGKDNKAVVASNIMYVVGQYPRFLKAHWRFLKTVVKKLFEFMHELHEGVQDMACDTFIKIAQRTRRHFVVQQSGESVPYIDEILNTIPDITSELQPQQMHVFFEAVGYLISAANTRQNQERLIEMLMAMPNSTWDNIMAAAARGVPVLEDLNNVKVLASLLRTNTAACSSIGAGFKKQMARNYMDMLGLYRAASGAIAQSLAADPTTGFARPLVRALRSIKKETLRLFETYVSKADDLEDLTQQMVPLLLDACLGDYAQNPPQTRDAEVLHVIAEFVNKLGKWMHSQVAPILNAVFACTLEMINKELVEYPEHRSGFFKLLKALVQHCFPAILALPAETFQQVINSIVWGFKHTMRDISDLSLSIVSDLFANIESKTSSDVANQFYQRYYLDLMQDVFFVLTDMEHKSGFHQQCVVLQQMMRVVTTGQMAAPLPGAEQRNLPNVAFLQEHLTSLLQTAFPHVSPKAVHVFVVGLLELNVDITKFKPHVRDFLIQLKEFTGNADDLYLAEREAEIAAQKQEAFQAALRVPGLIKPSELEDDDM